MDRPISGDAAHGSNGEELPDLWKATIVRITKKVRVSSLKVRHTWNNNDVVGTSVPLKVLAPSLKQVQ